MPQLTIGPELHAYLVAAVKKFDATLRRDPRWLQEVTSIEATAPESRTRRQNALLSSDLVHGRLYEEAIALLDAAREEPESPPVAASAG